MDVNDWHDIEYTDGQPGSSFMISVMTGVLTSDQVYQIAQLALPVAVEAFGGANTVSISQVIHLFTTSEQIVAPVAPLALLPKSDE